MNNPLLSLLQNHNISAQLYGLPGTYKTTFLLQIIQLKLKEGFNRKIFLIDTSGNFPIVRLKSIKDQLRNLVIFQPKTLKEIGLLLDDLTIKLLSKDSILLIDDVFRHTNLEKKETIHLNSYIMALVKTISNEIDFPVILTNQARSYDNEIHPFLQNLTLHYLDWHFLFEKIQKTQIRVSFFKNDKYINQSEYRIDSAGFFTNMDL
ncbi:MAG: hypothetical protein ACFE9L_15285 [Candidatus Hodarchaeota archaeon]